MSDAWTSLTGTYRKAWQTLVRGAEGHRRGVRYVSLATTGLDSRAETRIVALRMFDQEAGVLTVFTDAETRKVKEIAAEPRGSILIWNKRKSFQIRCRVNLSCVAGSLDEWSAMDETSRRNYGGSITPGEPISRPEDFVAASNPTRFVVIDARIDELETVHLGRDRNRRALFAREDGFKGTWLAP